MSYWTLVWLMLVAPAAIGGAHVWQVEERATLAQPATDPAQAATDITRLGTPWDARGAPPAPAADAAASEPVRIIPPTDRAPAQRLDLTDQNQAAPPPETPAQAPELLVARNALATLIPIRDRTVAATGILTRADPQMQLLILLLSPLLFMAASFGYHAARIREFMNARRIAGVRARCTFGGGALLNAWLATIWRSIWPGFLVYMLAGLVMMILFFSILSGDAAPSNPFDLLQRGGDWRAQGLVIMAFALNYGTIALFGIWLAEVVWCRAVHHALCAGTELEGLETLDLVRRRALSGPQNLRPRRGALWRPARPCARPDWQLGGPRRIAPRAVFGGSAQT